MEALIQYLGSYLGRLMKRDPQPTRGLLRMVLKSSLGDRDILNIEDLVSIFNTELLQRLERLDIENARNIVEDLKSELIRNQSFITMAYL